MCYFGRRSAVAFYDKSPIILRSCTTGQRTMHFGYLHFHDFRRCDAVMTLQTAWSLWQRGGIIQFETPFQTKYSRCFKSPGMAGGIVTTWALLARSLPARVGLEEITNGVSYCRWLWVILALIDLLILVDSVNMIPLYSRPGQWI